MEESANLSSTDFHAANRNLARITANVEPIEVDDSQLLVPETVLSASAGQVQQHVSMDDIVTEAVTVTIQQAVQSIELLSKTSRVLDSALENATFEQKIIAMQESAKLSDSTSTAITAATNLFLALGIRVQCDTPIRMTSIVPQSLQSNRLATNTGFEADENLPSASRYNLTYKLRTAVDISPRELVDMYLKGTGCQTVGRTTGPGWVTIRLENRQQLMHAHNVLKLASYNGTPLISLGTLETVTKSAYSVRSFPFEVNNVIEWFDKEHLKIELAIKSLNESNSGWFPNQDVESLEYYPAATPRGKDPKTKFIVFKIFVSQAAYRHFLRSSHDITNVEINGHLIKVKEEVNIIQCWNCVKFGHYSNQCHNSFCCRFCLDDHPAKTPCASKDEPKCKLCDSNNKLLEIKKQSGDHSPGVTHFKDWVTQPIDHCATSFSCKTIQSIKAMHLLKLKQAAFQKLPLPAFSFP